MAVLDLFRTYDKAIVDLVKRTVNPVVTGLDIDVSDNVEFAAPERPYAAEARAPQDRTEADTLRRVPGLPHDHEFADLVGQSTSVIDKNRAVQTMATPRVSVTRQNWVYSMRRNINRPIRRIRLWDEQADFWITQKKHPRPIDMMYQIDIITRFRDDMNKCLRWYIQHPDNTYTIPIEFGYPWGRKFIDLFFENFIDNSDIETQERERWIRYTIPLSVEGWMLEGFESDQDIPFDADAPEFAITRKVRNVKKVTAEYHLVTALGDDKEFGTADDTTILVDSTSVSGSLV